MFRLCAKKPVASLGVPWGFRSAGGGQQIDWCGECLVLYRESGLNRKKGWRTVQCLIN